MLYNVRKFLNPTDKSDPKVFHASPVWEREIDIRDISDEISHASSINIADVRAVIESFLYHMPAHLMKGDVIRFNDFGIFKLTFHSKPREKEEDVRASDIDAVRVYFRPSKILKNKIAMVRFDRVNSLVKGGKEENV